MNQIRVPMSFAAVGHPAITMTRTIDLNLLSDLFTVMVCLAGLSEAETLQASRAIPTYSEANTFVSALDPLVANKPKRCREEALAICPSSNGCLKFHRRTSCIATGPN